MKKIVLLFFITMFVVGCGPSEETINLSEGIAAYQVIHHRDVMVLLKDPEIIKKYPELVKKIDKNGQALARANHGLWLLLKGVDRDEILK